MGVICRGCDRGNRYCSPACSQQSRTEAQAEAGKRYQQSKQGSANHARRQRDYSDRRKQKLTHQGSGQTGDQGEPEVAAEPLKPEAVGRKETDAQESDRDFGPRERRINTLKLRKKSIRMNRSRKVA
jgi:hypothetical protein